MASITRTARLRDAAKIKPLMATLSPAKGLGGAMIARPNTPVANAATTTRIQKDRRARRSAEIPDMCYIPKCCLVGVIAIRIVRAIITNRAIMVIDIRIGRRRQKRLGLRSTKGRIANRPKKTSSP
jgi:hypothetical protein